MRRDVILYCACFLFFACQKKENTLFEKIETGIDFQNTVTSTEELNAFTFTNFYNGGGVGIGDFNNDGFKDLVFTSNQEKPGLYLNQGAFTFLDVSQNTGLTNTGWITGVSVVDINQDGWDDIYLGMASHLSLKDSKNKLYINQKTSIPSFIEAAADYGLDYNGFTTHSAFFDFDNDGDLDVFLLNTAPDNSNPNYLRPAVNNGSHPSTDKLFENIGFSDSLGNYIYKDISLKAGIVYEGLGLGVALSDFNQDGNIDIYCSNDFMSSDIFYLNQGDGTFINSINTAMDHTSMYGMGVDAVDYNNDSRADIFQLDMLPEGNERQKQMIASSDYEKKKQSVSSRFNYTLQYMRNSLQLNLGNTDKNIPRFSEVGLLEGVAKTDWSWSILLADYDLDGFKDVFITNGYRKNVTDLDFVSFNKENNFFGTDKAREIKRNELLAAVPEIQLMNYAFKNDPKLGFQNVSSQWGLDELSYANGAAYADLDNDGDLDLVVNNIDAPASVFKNNLNTGKSTKVTCKGATGNLKGIGNKITAWRDGNMQFYELFTSRGYLSSQPTEIIVGGALDSISVTWSNGKSETKTVLADQTEIIFDLNDAVVRKSQEIQVEPLFEKVELTKQIKHEPSDFIDFNKVPALHKMQTRSGPKLTHSDINGDGYEDIILSGSYRGSPTRILYFKNGMMMKEDSILHEGIEVGVVLAIDLDADETKELIMIPSASERPFGAEGAYQPLAYKNVNGQYFVQKGILPSIEVNSRASVLFDFDQDGDEDLIIAGHHTPGCYPQSSQSYVLRNDNGIFTRVEHKIAELLSQQGLITDLKVTDWDQDGDGDLALVSEWGEAKLLVNTGSDFEAKSIIPNVQGWWNSIHAGDLDNDGDIDFLLGNEGLNTIFRASKSEPVRLYAKDYNGDGNMDPLMSYYLQGKEVPVQPRGTLSQQVIQLRKHFKLYSEYAEASMNDVLRLVEREGAIELQVNELKSIIALNNGDGSFTIEYPPREAQKAPIQDAIINDFNSDGFNDIVIVGGYYDNESNLGQQDALHGVILQGKSDGSFETLSLEESDFFINGDSRSIVMLKEEGLLFIGVNKGFLQAFRLNK